MNKILCFRVEKQSGILSPWKGGEVLAEQYCRQEQQQKKSILNLFAFFHLKIQNCLMHALN